MRSIQSFLLLIVIVALLLANLVPIWSGANDTLGYVIFSTFCREIDSMGLCNYCIHFPYILVSLLNFIAVGTTVCELLMYRNRNLQIQLGVWGTLVMLGMLGLSLYLSLQKAATLVTDVHSKWLSGFWLMIVAIISNLLASRFIRRDIQRIRYANRIR